ncbi:MAG: molybdopterin-dependent oxidoreductase [Alphaproteobacteria bacterium]|nr:molybdopterin-dependent oxidoreductase [Alphaproteobacteria bacterium]
MQWRKLLSPSDRDGFVKDAAKSLDLPSRRLFLKRAAGIGTIAAITGVAIVDGPSAEKALASMSKFNDRAQAWLFDPTRMAKTYSQAEITRPYPFNAFYEAKDAPEAGETYELLVGGLVQNKKAWKVEALQALPQATQITQHVCIEGWSAIGKWRGVRLRDFLVRVGADLRAKYVTFNCLDRYSTQIDMPSALHPQTVLALSFLDEALPKMYGAPVRLRVPTKLGFKSAKHVYEIVVSNDYVEGFWERQGYNWFAGL